ncbi:MAG: divalent-cation tolerance protein CutA [Planctomycetes bacterium]|nr:divalent-cation tolerance protein CutA [Planctomycetota bacterium]
MTAAAIVVLCTAPAAAADGRASADDLARRLVDEGLCACVNVVSGVRSFFRWEGAVDVADEVLLVAKTTRDAAPRLRQRILELHPYQVPEVLELAVDGGSPAYLKWLSASVTPPRDLP